MSGTAELTCREVVELVNDYLEGTMAPPDRVRFEEHIEGCDGCANYLDQIRTTIRVAGSVQEDAIPAGELDRLTQAFRNWHRS